MSEVKLTSRQQIVVDGLKAKKTPQTIAKEMGVSVNGVYGHIRRLKKAGVIRDHSANGAKATGRKRATTSRRRRSSNGSSPNPIVEALDVAKANGKTRVGEIEAAIEELQAEKDAILSALG